MIDAIGNHWPVLLLLVILLALLGLRAPVIARARVFIKAPIDHVFDLIDLKDGVEQHWHRAKVSVQLLDAASETYRIRYAVAQSGGERVFHAEFRVGERRKPVRLVLDRAGLEGRPHANELLQIIADLAPSDEGSHLTFTYHWGPRPLIAQLIARSDLYVSVYRIKAFAETGTAASRAGTLIGAGIAIGTGLVTLVGFGLWFGWDVAVLILIALCLHEFGHLLAFRLVGQPWGRIVFLPFLGALAMPRLPFTSDGQHAFAALMGPGFSIVGVLPVLACAAAGVAAPGWLLEFAGVVAILNLFNLMPVEPLDGGVALRAVLSRFFKSRTHLAMMASSGLIAIAGFALRSPILVVLGIAAAAANFRPRSSAGPSAPLTFVEIALIAGGSAVTGAAHLAGLVMFALHR